MGFGVCENYAKSRTWSLTWSCSRLILYDNIKDTIYSQVNIMLQLNVNEVKTHLCATLDRVIAGETVIVCKRNKPIAEIKSISSSPQAPLTKRVAGYGAKEYPDFKLPDNFNDPLPDDIIGYFVGEK
jgi:antitoxin (DNA-binding transcriptional repressor) of toxin-antitoxin stability system